MPTTDAYGQGISITAPTDAPDMPATAQALAGGLVPRSVMRFASASTRNATLTSPVAGMVAFLQDTKLFTGYDGTSWVVLAAGTQAWTTIPLVSGYSHNGNANGNAQYRIVNLFGEPTVMLRGGVGLTYPSGSLPNASVMTSSALPSAARPTALRTVAAACSAATSTVTSLKIDAQPGGHLLVVGTGTNDKPPWVSLNGCFYSL
ncbi:hypothetical protein OOK39_01990 [Streptomyces sp. NBC_00264]|uniref:hypothetical protein n=1 Tax=unclassified Streptomyces TaxID=2593676 RepID=UPI00224D4012|nr:MULTISPECIES: hypothetical protein [unclassified Streptomyces]MCX4849861.1 hypothetical protein [Streptomyces sp. NBC_00893]MCX4863442.1 hypothetical protein [Streptomyces sp. NBC_00906]MCX4894679.1 hypothetical protein [Streptomyces sp. NBC_00892]MCX5158072.1 hypothetical protein [Streptomyces sp. NBC_00305]MCX5216595.1 hypothetical protein [Streptomyces sp. NBC_00264]